MAHIVTFVGRKMNSGVDMERKASELAARQQPSNYELDDNTCRDDSASQPIR